MRHHLREKWRRREPALVAWVTLESPSVTAIVVVLDLDWACVAPASERCRELPQ